MAKFGVHYAKTQKGMAKKAKKSGMAGKGKERRDIQASLRPAAPARRHRQVIYLNDSELAAIRLYSAKFKVRSRSALIRESVMLRVLSVLDENQPTLF